MVWRSRAGSMPGGVWNVERGGRGATFSMFDVEGILKVRRLGLEGLEALVLEGGESISSCMEEELMVVGCNAW